MLPHMKNILDAGASAIGGCCGTTPAHIALFSTLDLSKPASPAWDGTKYICSARAYVSLDEALENAAEIDDPEDLYDLEDEAAAIINLTNAEEDEIADLLIEAQMATNVPFIFRCENEAVLEAALLNYPGVAAVYAPDACSDVCKRYGAYLLD